MSSPLLRAAGPGRGLCEETRVLPRSPNPPQAGDHPRDTVVRGVEVGGTPDGQPGA